MEALGAKIITLKDMAGLVNPSRAASIISKLKANLKVPVDFHTHCTPGIRTRIVGNGHHQRRRHTRYQHLVLRRRIGSTGHRVDLPLRQKARRGTRRRHEGSGQIREALFDIRKSLAAFDLQKDHFPRRFDPLTDTVPAEVDAQFDKAVAAARAGDEATLLDACHAIEDYFGFPKSNETVKNAEVPGGMYSNMVAQLKQLQAIDLLDDAMKLIPKVRRDAGLVPLVTPTSQIVGSQAVLVALDRKKGQPDYSHPSNQFISLVKGEYGHTPVPVDPEFRAKITGSPVERPYDTSTYRKPENPVLADLGGVKLASNDEEYLLLELLPNVANGFLRNRRTEEYNARAAEQAATAAAEEAAKEPEEPITGEVMKAPMGGTVISINVKPGDQVKPGDLIMVYEAMKMENEVAANKAATVKRVFVKPGDVVGLEANLIEFE